MRAAPGEAPGSWEYAAFQTAVTEQLAEVGYIVNDCGASLLIGSAGLGNTLGIVIGSWTKSRRPERVVLIGFSSLFLGGAREGIGLTAVLLVMATPR